MALPRYEGYKNYPSWNVNLWIQNEESSYRYWTARAKEIYEAAREVVPTEDLHRKVVIALASELQDTSEEHILTIVGTYADLLGWALKYVDWCEISENLLEDE